MTAHELDQPRMIYTGALPPHLLRAEEPYVEDELEAPAEEPRPFQPILPVAVATGVALALGIAIGVFAPSLFRGPPAPQASPSPDLQAVALAPAPVARPPAEPIALLPQTSDAEPQPRHAAPTPALRIAVARLAPSPAAAAPRRAATDARVCAADACADTAIVAAENDLQHAYQRALSAGIPADVLRVGQIDWLLTRQAATGSTAELAGAYRQRIAQLNALADEPPH